MEYLNGVNYQPVVDMLVKLGNQLNKPAYRFLKGEVIALALEKATKGRLVYVDEEGFDSIDTVTGLKYELKSTFSMFTQNKITGRVTLSNTNKNSFTSTFDHLLCIQTNPHKFAIAQISLEDCIANCETLNGQFNLKRGIMVTNWVCKDKTQFNQLPLEKLEIRKLLENVLGN
jgi:hypothetical protein